MLTGKVFCGECGKLFASVSRDYLACRVAVFAAEFTAEWNRLAAEASVGADAKRRKLETVRRKVAGLIDAIADGLRAPGLQRTLDELEASKAALEAEVAAMASPAPPRLHPNIAEVYRDKVARLQEALGAEGGTEVLEAFRALVDRLEVHPPSEVGGAARIELVGHLASMLRAAGAAGVVVASGHGKSPRAGAGGPSLFAGSVQVDAGTRIGLCRTSILNRVLDGPRGLDGSRAAAVRPGRSHAPPDVSAKR